MLISLTAMENTSVWIFFFPFFPLPFSAMLSKMVFISGAELERALGLCVF